MIWKKCVLETFGLHGKKKKTYCQLRIKLLIIDIPGLSNKNGEFKKNFRTFLFFFININSALFGIGLKQKLFVLPAIRKVGWSEWVLYTKSEECHQLLNNWEAQNLSNLYKNGWRVWRRVSW